MRDESLGHLMANSVTTADKANNHVKGTLKLKEAQHLKNQKAAIDFLETTMGHKMILVENSLHQSLKDGILLCQMINKLKPNAIQRISLRALPFLQMENISNFIEAAKDLGIKDSDLFQTVDLYEGKNMDQVGITILQIARVLNGEITKSNRSQEGEGVEKVADLGSESSIDSTRQTIGRRGSVPRLMSTNVSQKTSESLVTQSQRRNSNLGSGGHKETAAGSTRGETRVDVGNVVLLGYQLGNCIGKGQFGAVYKALNLETGRMLAIKRIQLTERNGKEVDELMQEVELLKSLDHPYIVRYEGFIRDNEFLSIILEFVENGSLSSVLKTFGNMPEKLVVNYVVQILEGLEYLHLKGVVHCDLKAANILNNKDGTAKLSDFGVSMQLNSSMLDQNTKACVGTPNWMAPEIIELNGASTKSDIWSLGCTIIELLTGRAPYGELNAMTALFRIVEDDHPPFPEGISEDLYDFLIHCFQKDVNSRWSATQLQSHPWILKNQRPMASRSGSVHSTMQTPAKSILTHTPSIQESFDEKSSQGTSKANSAISSPVATKIQNRSFVTNVPLAGDVAAGVGGRSRPPTHISSINHGSGPSPLAVDSIGIFNINKTGASNVESHQIPASLSFSQSIPQSLSGGPTVGLTGSQQPPTTSQIRLGSSPLHYNNPLRKSPSSTSQKWTSSPTRASNMAANLATSFELTHTIHKNSEANHNSEVKPRTPSRSDSVPESRVGLSHISPQTSIGVPSVGNHALAFESSRGTDARRPSLDFSGLPSITIFPKRAVSGETLALRHITPSIPEAGAGLESGNELNVVSAPACALKLTEDKKPEKKKKKRGGCNIQ